MENGIQTRLVAIGFDEGVDRIEALLKGRGINLFCVIDHSGEAEAVGLRMPKTKLLRSETIPETETARRLPGGAECKSSSSQPSHPAPAPNAGFCQIARGRLARPPEV